MVLGNQPLCRIISRFGTLLPQPEPDLDVNASRGVEIATECINAAFISFQKLKMGVSADDQSALRVRPADQHASDFPISFSSVALVPT
jgi:hypothetical protein